MVAGVAGGPVARGADWMPGAANIVGQMDRW